MLSEIERGYIRDVLAKLDVDKSSDASRQASAIRAMILAHSELSAPHVAALADRRKEVDRSEEILEVAQRLDNGLAASVLAVSAETHVEGLTNVMSQCSAALKGIAHG